MTEETKVDEISLKELFLKIGSLSRFLLSRWFILLIAGIIGGALGLVKAIYTKPTYTGTLTFVLCADSKGSGLSGLASQFGLDMGSSGGNDVFSGDNILTLFKSERMLKLVLFKKPPAGNDILANIIVKEWEWDKKWKKKRRTDNQFPFPEDVTKISPVQDSLLREVYARILKKGLSVVRIDRKLSVYSLSNTSTNELFACYLTTFLMDETAKFYIDTKTSLAKQNLAMLHKEADSLRRLFGSAVTATATAVDRTFNLNPALQVQRVSAQKQQFSATVVGTAYSEVIKNLELAKIQLQKETPLYQIVDIPKVPLKMEKYPKMYVAILAAFIFIILTAMYILLKKIIIAVKR